MGVTAGIIGALGSILGGVATGVGQAAHGGPPSPIDQSQKGGAGAGGYVPTALRLSDIMGKQGGELGPDDELRLGQLLGLA